MKGGLIDFDEPYEERNLFGTPKNHCFNLHIKNIKYSDEF